MRRACRRYAAIIATRTGRARKCADGVRREFAIAPAPAAVDADIDAGPIVNRQHRQREAKARPALGHCTLRVHDLRRTCATNLGELGVQPHYIEAILNHYSGHRAALAGVYQRAKYEPEMRAALQKWADYVDRITAWGRGEQTHTAPYSRCTTFPPGKNFSDRNTRPTVSHNLLKKCRPRPRSAIFGGGDTEIGAAPSYADESGPDFRADRFVHAMNARSATSSPAVA